MPERSAGILMFRRSPGGIEVLLVHPGGPFWARKDLGAWSIPKGLVDPGEDLRAAALREFAEETGSASAGDLLPLGDFKAGAKLLTIFALEGDFDIAGFKSNRFSMEWPPRSGRRAEFPEADRAAWFTLDRAAEKLVRGQRPVLDALAERLAERD